MTLRKLILGTAAALMLVISPVHAADALDMHDTRDFAIVMKYHNDCAALSGRALRKAVETQNSGLVDYNEVKKSEYLQLIKVGKIGQAKWCAEVKPAIDELEQWPCTATCYGHDETK